MTRFRRREKRVQTGRTTVTPAQLVHLAEQADFAAGFFRTTNPSVADRFAHCATAARRMAQNMERDDERVRIRVELADVADRLGRRTRLDSQTAAVPAVSAATIGVVPSV
jgi:hypothetical protein